MKIKDDFLEEWKLIAGYELLYEVSNHGRVRSADRNLIRKDGYVYRRKGRILKQGMSYGYLQVSLCRGGMKRSVRVHKLVLETFVGPRPEGEECCHYDGDPTNNSLENLRWDTPKANFVDTLRAGRNFARNKTHCPRGHELRVPNVVARMAKQGYRECLACHRAHGYLQHRQCLKSNLKEISDSYYEQILKESAQYQPSRPGNTRSVFAEKDTV